MNAQVAGFHDQPPVGNVVPVRASVHLCSQDAQKAEEDQELVLVQGDVGGDHAGREERRQAWQDKGQEPSPVYAKEGDDHRREDYDQPPHDRGNQFRRCLAELYLDAGHEDQAHPDEVHPDQIEVVEGQRVRAQGADQLLPGLDPW